MFKLIDFEPEHALELMAAGIKEETADLDAERVELLAKFPAMTGICDDTIVCCGGMIILYPEYRAESWTMLSSEIQKFRVDYKMIKKQVHTWMTQNKIVRLEAPLRADFMPGITFAEHQGFKIEAILEKYHPDGCDAMLHTIIKERA